jgi:phosphate:Na+ symporter
MSALQLRNQEDAVTFRLANDMIEQLNEVARFSRAIAKATGWLHQVQVAETPEPA